MSLSKFSRILCLITAIGLLCSCSRIPDYSESSDSSDFTASDNSESQTEFSESDAREFDIIKREYIIKLNAEGGTHSGEILEDGNHDGYGYVKLRKSGILKHIASVNTSQHYRVIIAARSEIGASISLKISDKVCGTYYVPKAPEYEDFKFEYYAVEHQYLAAGQNVLQFTVEDGEAEIDYIVVENSDAVDSGSYNAGTSPANSNSSLRTTGVMSYLSGIYGKQVLTAQNVTFGTNTELNAVYKATGRYPAIRASDLAYLGDEDSAKSETELAAQFGTDGGILFYTWHWYSPNGKHTVNSGALDVGLAFEGERYDEVALYDSDVISAHVNAGYMTDELVALIEDTDKIAEFLKPFSEADIPVLFAPAPDPDSGLYWWGDSAKDYIELWRFVFDRLCYHHKLKNLIWVWNGSDEDYYPGARYVDIVGQSFFENSNSSFAGRFAGLYSALPTEKMLGITFCDVLPSIDYMNRDNALWLFAAAGNGSYTVNSNGELCETFNKAANLHYFYNHRLTVAMDELPDFSSPGLLD